MSIRRRVAEALAVAALGAGIPVALAAELQYLYKWTDKEGKTQYSDQIPKNPGGPVTRIEVEAPPAIPLGAPGVRMDAPPSSIEIAARRRAVRIALEAEVTKARAKVDKARAALADATPDDTEKQVIQQRTDKQNAVAGAGSKSTGGMLGQGGMLGAAPRSNCRDEGASVVCPTIVPGEAYYDRVQKLEDEVKRAEEELSAAEQAYRRGVD